MGGERRRKGKLFNARRAISLHVALVVLTVAALSGIIIPPNTRAGDISLSAGNVTLTLNDYGVITNEISWNMLSQTHIVYDSYLTIHHDAYPSGGGNTEVASGYGFGGGDFTVEEPNTYLHSGSTQETYSSFIQTGVSGVSNDLRIYQRAYSKEGEDWAVLMWKLENIYGQDIYDLRVGMNFRTRVADTPANDIDYWNAADSTYYIVDSPTGSTFMGLATGDPTYPLNHYYGDAAGTQGAVDPADDRKLYQALTTNQVHGSSAEITCMVGWEVGFLAAGENVTLPLVIGFGTNYQEVAAEVTDSQQFLNLYLTKLMITEIQDSISTGSVKIEIYNNGGRDVSTSDIYLSPDGTTQWTAGTWSTGSVLSGKHATYSLGPGESFASIEGGNVSLHNLTGSVFDWVAFGQEGPAPDPIVDESIARFWRGMNYTDDWVRDPTPTFGTYNNRMGRRDPPPVVLSEVYFNAHSLNERFIELYYPGNSSRDLSGWTVVVDSEYALPAYMMDANNRHFVLRGEDFPIGFDMDDGISYGDNVYLYNDLGELTDMVGWSSAHIKGQSMTRLENETLWGFDGYDDISSLQAGWRFNRTPTPMTISIGPDQSMFATLGEVVDYYVFLRNFGSGPDCFDLTFISTLGWETSVTDSLGNPIVDHDSDGVPDSDLMAPGDVLSLRVSVTAPMNTDDGNYNAVYLTATSSVNAKLRGTVVLRTTVNVPPYIVANKSAYPDTIWLEGSPFHPQETTITLNVTGAGIPEVWYLPQDTVFVIDQSGSMVTNDPGNLRLSAAKAYVDLMEKPDRAATVAFAYWAELVNGTHLTSDYAQVKADIDSIPYPGSSTNISMGLRLANDELIGVGRSDHTWMEILLTDGWSSDDFMIYKEVQRAASHDITIFTIGLGNSVDEAMLRDVADITGGQYYSAPTADVLVGIYQQIYQRQKVMNIAGLTADDPMAPNPMIRDVLPPFINYVPNSFRDQNMKSCPPDNITINPDGTTLLDWNVEKILINQTWIVEYKVTSSESGTVPVGVYPLSRVNYKRWDNITRSVFFPEVLINVLVSEPVDNPILNISTDQNDVQLSWSVPGPNISHYLIYRSSDQREFDFSTPYNDTSVDWDNGVIPDRTTWNDTGAAALDPREYYYVVRAVNNLGIKSPTSNTVGKWTKAFNGGLNTLSLPLEPPVEHDIEWYANAIPNTVYIDRGDDEGRWVRHWKGDPVTKPKSLMIGEGFEIYLSAPSKFTFVGAPASMIKFQEGLGDSLTFREGLTARVIQENVHLYWEGAVGAGAYNVYKSTSRVAFHNGNMQLLSTVEAIVTDWVDVGALVQPSNWYYMVIPINSNGREGSSTYSIGVLSVSFDVGHTVLGLPLKPNGLWTLDYYCEAMRTVVGMAYLVKGVWKFHATEMPVGVYDTLVEQAEGYQVSVMGQLARYTFIGY